MTAKISEDYKAMLTDVANAMREIRSKYSDVNQLTVVLRRDDVLHIVSVRMSATEKEVSISELAKQLTGRITRQIRMVGKND